MHFPKKLQTKIFIYFILVVLLPLIGIGTISYLISINFMEKQIINSQTQTIGLIQNNIKLMFDDVYGISSYIMDNETVQSLLNQPTADHSNDAQAKMMNYLSSLKIAKKYISFVIIYGENGFQFRYFNDIYREVIPYEQLKETPTYVSTAANDGEATWNSSSAPLFSFLNSYNDIMIGRRITGIYDRDQKLGMIFIGINRDAMGDLIKDINISESTNLLLMDDNYNVVENNEKDDQLIEYVEGNLELKKKIVSLKNTSVIRIPDKDYFVSVSEIKTYHWNVASLTPLDEIRAQHKILLRITLFLSLSLLLVVGLISAFLSRSITSPIKRLLRSMSNFKRGDFNQNVTVHSNDEIGLLTQKYNEMASELNEMIQKVYISQTNQKIIELKTLQAQIEPHFLYNTLDFIFLNSKINGDNQTAKVVQSLSDLFRISLNQGQDFYKLEYEIKQIKSYINIQHARFPHRFQPVFEIDPDIEQYYTAKLILQPIVENAIIHAFDKKKNEKGILRISGIKTKEHVVFSVEDNGRGMTDEQIAKLLNVKGMSSGGYGIRNVNERLTMLFGEEHSLQIESEVGRGTKVTIVLPIIKSEEEWGMLYENYGHR